MTAGRLEEILPGELKKKAIACGKEFVLPFTDAAAAILVATEHAIVLGVDAFEVRPDGLATVALFDTAPNNTLAGDWKAYVALLMPNVLGGSTNIASERITAGRLSDSSSY